VFESEQPGPGRARVEDRVRSLRDLLDSWRSASIGFSREAFKAGKKPETTPTVVV